MKKILVVYYSYTGTSRRVADFMQASGLCDVGEVQEIKPRAGALGYARCIIDSWLRRAPYVHYKGPHPGAYDAVVLLAPIWMMQLASPMRAFIKMFDARWPDIAVISVMGSAGAPHAVDEITQLTGQTPIMNLALTAAAVQDGSMAASLQAFVEALESAQTNKAAVARQATLSSQAA